MSIASKLMFASAVLAAHTVAAEPDSPETTAPADGDILQPPASVDVLPKPPPPAHKNGITGTTERWGGGVRLTGLSGMPPARTRWMLSIWFALEIQTMDGRFPSAGT